MRSVLVARNSTTVQACLYFVTFCTLFLSVLVYRIDWKFTNGITRMEGTSDRGSDACNSLNALEAGDAVWSNVLYLIYSVPAKN